MPYTQLFGGLAVWFGAGRGGLLARVSRLRAPCATIRLFGRVATSISGDLSKW